MAPNKLAITTKTWDEARIARLAQLWREGYSAEDIAGALGGTTRNAVLGKIHRLGIQDTAGARAPQTDRARLSRFRPTMPAHGVIKRAKSGAVNRAINVALRVQAARLPELQAPLPLPDDPAPHPPGKLQNPRRQGRRRPQALPGFASGEQTHSGGEGEKDWGEGGQAIEDLKRHPVASTPGLERHAIVPICNIGNL